jgi:hypothetical protein
MCRLPQSAGIFTNYKKGNFRMIGGDKKNRAEQQNRNTERSQKYKKEER